MQKAVLMYFQKYKVFTGANRRFSIELNCVVLSSDINLLLCGYFLATKF